MCFDFPYDFFFKYFSFSEEMSEVRSNTYIGLHVKYPLFLSDFNETWSFSTDFRQKTQISNFMTIRPVGAELFHEEGRTARRKDGQMVGQSDRQTRRGQ